MLHILLMFYMKDWKYDYSKGKYFPLDYIRQNKFNIMFFSK